MATFTEKELHRYEAEIRKKPLAMLYRELQKVEDESPERQKIVKARIAALVDREKRINTAKEKEWQIAKQKALQEIRNMPQPLPDKMGLVEFLAATAIPFIILLFGNCAYHYRGVGYHSRGLIWDIFWKSHLSGKSIESFNFESLLYIIKFLPIIGILLWFFYSYIKKIYPTKRPKNFDFIDTPSYWLLHFKLALSIASFFFFYSLEIFFSGNYNGFFYTGYGLPAYIIGAIYLVSSTLFIVNTFYPLSKIRTKYGLTLLATAAVTEVIVNAIFS